MKWGFVRRYVGGFVPHGPGRDAHIWDDGVVLEVVARRVREEDDASLQERSHTNPEIPSAPP
jgi:hypothetical protein